MDLSNENASSLINEVGRFCPKLHCGRPEVWGAIAGVGGEVVPRWWLVLVGIAGILAGVLAFVWPDITAQVLLALIAAWAIMIGVLQIVGAIQLRKEIEGEWLLGLSGLLWILFGVALVAQPSAGAVAVVWMIASFAILLGCLYIALAFRLKQYK